MICNRNRLAYTKRLVNLSELQTQIGKNLSYGVLPWGQSLKQIDDSIFDVPIVLMLEREMITRSRSLHFFINRLHQNRFHNNLLLLATEDAQQKWNTPSHMETLGAAECSWNHNFCSIDKIVVHDVYSASKAILDYRTSWKPGMFTIGVSYAHEDSYEEPVRGTYHSDISLLRMVVDQLKSIYGEHQILFDQYKKASQMFVEDQARERSLDGYRTCKVFLVLWNTHSVNRVNCQKEREVIQERCRTGQAHTIYLLPPGAPKPPESDFGLELNENNIQTIVNEVERKLRNLQ